MISPFIFDSDNLKKNSEDLSAIYTCMGMYYEGVETANTSLLDEVFYEDWYMRDTDTPKETTLNVEDKQTFIKRVFDHGPYSGYAKERVFATVGMANDRLALVRVNKEPSRNSTSFFLYKSGDKWKIIDKVWVNAKDETTSANRLNEYSKIEGLIYDYFEAISSSNIEKLDKILHEQWNLKHITSDGKPRHWTKQEFLNNNQGEYMDFSQLLSVDLYHEKLAIARIDILSASTTTFITFFKIDGIWKIAMERRVSN